MAALRQQQIKAEAGAAETMLQPLSQQLLEGSTSASSEALSASPSSADLNSPTGSVAKQSPNCLGEAVDLELGQQTKQGFAADFLGTELTTAPLQRELSKKQHAGNEPNLQQMSDRSAPLSVQQGSRCHKDKDCLCRCSPGGLNSSLNWQQQGGLYVHRAMVTLARFRNSCVFSFLVFCLTSAVLASSLVAQAVTVTIAFGIMWILMYSLEADLDRLHRKKQSEKCEGWRLPSPGGVMIGLSVEAEQWRRTKQSLQKLRIAATATGILMFAMMIAGHRVGSLALAGEGIHMMGDCLGYFALFFCTIICKWHPLDAFSYGYERAELLCSLAVAALQFHEAANIASETYERFQHPQPLRHEAGETVCALSFLSALVNAGLMKMMLTSRTGSSCGHNHGDMAVNFARIHIACDLGQNLIVVATGVVLLFWPDLYIVDSICVLFFLSMLALTSLPHVWEVIRVLMMAAPRNVDCNQVRKDLLAIKGVVDVRDVHVWSLTIGKVAASAHIYTEDEPVDVLDRASIIMRHKYAILEFALQVTDDV